ncbi:MAG: type II CAAX endopeptidase family protein [Eubacteriales bacterium]|nr:type II CAAX endopeptidase family protein [Eubacteriales bacterium]
MSERSGLKGIRKGLWTAGYILGPAVQYFALMIFVEIVLSVLLVLLQRLDAFYSVYELLSANESVLAMICISLPAFLIFYGMSRRDHYGYITDFGGRKRLPAAGSLIACACCMAIGLNVIILMTPLLELFPGFAMSNAELHTGMAWLVSIYSVLIAPVTEEALFRGVIYRRARKVFGVAPAILLSAFVFGLFHGNMVQFIYAFLIGLVLAFICERYGTLTAPMLFHIAANAGTVGAAPILGSPAPLPIAITILLAGCLFLWRIGRRVETPACRPVRPEPEIGETE